MKEQKTPLTDEIKSSGNGVGVSHRCSINANVDDASHEDPDYVQLRDLSEEVRPRATGVLSTLMALGINPEALGQRGRGQPLQTLLAKELSCSRYFRWAVVDNLVEKILQGLVLNKQDISQEDISFCKGMIRQVPSGRSLLLHQACGLRKIYAVRGLVLTTEMVLTKAVKIFITVSLSYRLYDWLANSNNDFVEFRAVFDNNSEKGVSSLARLLLANFDPTWLYLLLTSPVIAGVLKGLWDTRREVLTESAVTQLEEAVNHHTNALLKKYLWKDVLRQMIPMPGFSSVSERVQKAEQQIRWDGRITNEQRASLFSNIERLALQGRGISKINAMQSLAKIVHSLSIKDFHQFQQAGYPQETLVQVLRIKTQALRDLRMLSNRTRVQSEELEQSPATALQQSVISVVYANYLLWWLGMGTLKHSPLFWSFKLGKLALEGLFINALVESILDVIKCPNKKGFRMFFGDYEVWANDLTQDCFKEFVRQFRLISKEESFEPFLEQLSKFNLRALDSIDLRDKALTSNETREILNILKNKRASIKGLNLGRNKINDTMGLLFPNSLQFLHLWNNDLGTEGVQGLKLPDSLQFLALDDNGIGAGVQGLKLPNGLQSLSLNFNNIGAEGIQGLMLPDSLQSLDLGGNGIGDAGVHGLMLPDNLQSLYLWNNSIGAGVQGLKLPSSLQSLILSVNNIGDAGAQGLMLPDNLQSLDLRHNNLTDEGAQGLRLPGNLQSLDLSVNGIGDEGIQGLKLPNKLQSLILWENRIGDKGVQELNLPDNLQSLDLRYNNITNEGIQGLKLPTSLQSLDLGNNGIDANIQGLKLPESLQSLNLDSNDIGAEGAQRLRLPENLQSLSLGGNDIGDEGIQGLKLPGNLQSLNLVFNNIGPEGVQRLKLPENLQSLYLGYNSIGDEGAKRLKLPGGLQSLGLWNNNISDAGALGFKLPGSLQFLDLSDNAIGTEGTKGLQLPAMLQTLSLEGNNITDQGIQGLKLPDGLQVLYLSNNKIGGEGVNALLRKIPKTNLTNIDLTDNLYNVTAISSTRIIQQQILLRKCQSQLCYANIPLSQQNEYQTSAATRAEPLLFFGWLKKPFDKLAEYVDNCFSTTLDSIGTRLEKILSRSPSYFPNIRSSDIYDWQPSGSVMLHQFKAGGSNTLLLPAPQAAIRPSLGAVAR